MNTLDRIIQYFAPIYAKKRMKARSAMYAAAKYSRLNGPRNRTPSSVNSIIGNSSGPVTALTQQLVRDFPYFARAVDAWSAFTVGSGVRYQSKIRKLNGELNTELNRRIEDGFNRWAEKASLDGKMSFWDIQDLCRRQECESGEYIAVESMSNDPNRFVPYALQIIESQHLDTSMNQTWNGRSGDPVSIQQGIEYNALTGEPIAYHFKPQTAWNPDVPYMSETRIPAERVIHGFHAKRPGQLRGISPFASAIQTASSLGQLIEAELDGTKMAAKWLAMVETDRPDIRQANLLMTDSDASGDDDERIEEMENAVIEYLRPGEKITLASSNRPNSQFNPFVRLIISMVSASTGIPYEILSGDYQGMNFTTLRVTRNDFSDTIRPAAMRSTRQLYEPVKNRFLDVAYLSGAIELPGYASDPWLFQRGEWQLPGMKAIDPLKEAKANTDAMNTMQKSPQEIAAERGKDWEEVVQQFSEAKKILESAGFDVGTITGEQPSTASANNPAAVVNQ